MCSSITWKSRGPARSGRTPSAQRVRDHRRVHDLLQRILLRPTASRPTNCCPTRLAGGAGRPWRGGRGHRVSARWAV